MGKLRKSVQNQKRRSLKIPVEKRLTGLGFLGLRGGWVVHRKLGLPFETLSRRARTLNQLSEEIQSFFVPAFAPPRGGPLPGNGPSHRRSLQAGSLGHTLRFMGNRKYLELGL